MADGRCEGLALGNRVGDAFGATLGHVSGAWVRRRVGAALSELEGCAVVA